VSYWSTQHVLQDASRLQARLQKEVRLMERVQGCKNVVSLRGVFESDACLFIVQEFCDGGDLQAYVQVSVRPSVCPSGCVFLFLSVRPSARPSACR
jgi:serine/threonine protein kinase